MFPHGRTVAVIVVLIRQNENQPAQASEDGSGERKQVPSAFEEARWASETGDDPRDNEANDSCRVHRNRMRET